LGNIEEEDGWRIFGRKLDLKKDAVSYFLMMARNI